MARQASVEVTRAELLAELVNILRDDREGLALILEIARVLASRSKKRIAHLNKR